jgi:hypothetical protein
VNVQVGDVVQIVDEADAWFPCLVLVTKVTATRLIGCVLVPESNDGNKKVGQAYRFFKPEAVEYVGAAQVVPQ